MKESELYLQYTSKSELYIDMHFLIMFDNLMRNDWEMTTEKWLRKDWEMTEKLLRNYWEITEKLSVISQ